MALCHPCTSPPPHSWTRTAVVLVSPFQCLSKFLLKKQATHQDTKVRDAQPVLCAETMLLMLAVPLQGTLGFCRPGSYSGGLVLGFAMNAVNDDSSFF